MGSDMIEFVRKETMHKDFIKLQDKTYHHCCFQFGKPVKQSFPYKESKKTRSKSRSRDERLLLNMFGLYT